MFQRPLLHAGILAAAVGVPYVLLNEQIGRTARSVWNGVAGKAATDKAQMPAPNGLQQTSTGAQPANPAVPIEEAFRFDLSPQWITSRWPRVSTVQGDSKHLGLRVALISGTRPDDVAGSLTYYFDEHHQLQRITFIGLTGDPRRVLGATVTPYGLQSQPTTDVAHYLGGDQKQPKSEVIVRHLPVVRAEDSRARTEVTIDLRRPNSLAARQHGGGPSNATIIPSSYRRW